MKRNIFFIVFLIIEIFIIIIFTKVNFNMTNKQVHIFIEDNSKIQAQEFQIQNLIKYNSYLIKENNQLKEKNDLYKKLQSLSYEEWNYLYRVARAEAGANSAEGQKNVVYVILNRVNSEKFPDSIREVIFQENQFSCVSNQLYNKVEISDFTINNVHQAVLNYVEGESASGALYFTLNSFPYKFLFTDEVGHNFYR